MTKNKEKRRKKEENGARRRRAPGKMEGSGVFYYFGDFPGKTFFFKLTLRPNVFFKNVFFNVFFRATHPPAGRSQKERPNKRFFLNVFFFRERPV